MRVHGPLLRFDGPHVQALEERGERDQPLEGGGGGPGFGGCVGCGRCSTNASW